MTDSCSGKTCWCCASFATSGADGACSFTGFGAGSGSITLTLGGFGFSIPSDATIDGIQVALHGFGAGGSASVTVQLLTGGSSKGTSKTPTLPSGSTCSSSNPTTTAGSTSDLWGTTWTPSEINSIGVDLTTSADVFVNAAEVIVSYTTPTPTPTNTGTVTDTPTMTETPSQTPTVTNTGTVTETPTVTQTPSNTPTATNTGTATRTPTQTPTDTNTPTNTPTGTNTPTQTPTRTPSRTPTVTNTPTVTPTPTQTPTRTPQAPPIVGGNTAGSTVLAAETGNCMPTGIQVFDCAPGSCHDGNDTPLAVVSVQPPNAGASTFVTITLAQPLIAGHEIYITDGCTDPDLSVPVLVTAPATAPLLAPPAQAVLAGILALIGLAGLSRLGRARTRG